MPAARESPFPSRSPPADSPDEGYQLHSPDPLLRGRREPLLYSPSRLSSVSGSSPFSYVSSDAPTHRPLRFPSRQSVCNVVLTGLAKTFRKEIFWWLLTPFLLLVLWLIWSASTSIYSSSSRGLDYGLVIDAGSHGSRLSVFSWQSRVYDPGHPLTGPVTIPFPLCQGTAGPALSSFAEKRELSGARQTLKTMLNEAQVCLSRHGVSADAWGEFPLFLKATGGMRNLSQGVRDFLMESLRDALQDPEINPFQFHRSWARVISGEEEGVYGWLAANSVRGSLSDEPEKTVGALDMGGASMQITFSPEHTSVLEDFNAVHLGDRLIRLYSHSFLGYGWSDAFNRISTALGVEVLLAHIRDDPAFVKKNAKAVESLTSLVSEHTSASGGRARQNNSSGKDGRTPKRLRLEGKGEEDEEGKTPERQVTLTALHPCLPRGSKIFFKMPSLAYPERRFYVDLNVQKIAEYMRAAEYSRKDILKTVQSMAPYGAEMRHTLQDMQESHAVPEISPKSWATSHDRPDSMSALPAEGYPRWMDGSRIFDAPGSSAEGDGDKPEKDRDTDKGSKSPADPEPGSTAASPGKSGAVLVGQAVKRSPDASRARNPLPVPVRPGDAPTSGEPSGQAQGGKESGPTVSVSQDRTEGTREQAGGVVRAAQGERGANMADEPSETRDKRGGVEVTLDLKPKNTFLFHFLGSGDFGACRDRAYKLFHNSLCFINSCSFNGVYQPRLESSKFIAFGQYSKIHATLGLRNPTPLSAFLEATETICSFRLARLKARRRRGLYRPYGDSSLTKLCWKSLWSFAVLRQGFGFSLDSDQISFSPTTGTLEDDPVPGWTMGSMISEVNYFPWQMPLEKYQGLFHFAVAFLLMSVILAIILYHEVSYLRKRLKEAEERQIVDSVAVSTDSPCRCLSSS
ncbi:gda1 cd39 (nucleoside phosphatase) family protein [Cystoisospora suis]|uniref:Gda1 cd39 (Nucleoside phosphatase) family protein n=1 Tax=Cystoisospora suis TaxID=483139 RepID=A0A2C6L8Q5_9APIC|nr:gda1 cd39 (nucleoside phosphatase) family protein [Cystoisospora suis]